MHVEAMLIKRLQWGTNVFPLMCFATEHKMPLRREKCLQKTKWEVIQTTNQQGAEAQSLQKSEDEFALERVLRREGACLPGSEPVFREGSLSNWRRPV